MDSIESVMGSSSASSANTQPTESTRKRVNLLTNAPRTESGAELEIIRVSENETIVSLFSAEGDEVNLHYCNETDIGGYVICNGKDCALCQAGKKVERRILIPAYLPTSRSIGVLNMSGSLRPNSLYPQIQTVLRMGKPVVAFIRKEGDRKFIVTTSELNEDEDGGETVINDFLERWNAGKLSLDSGFQRLTNEQLKLVPEIAQVLRFKAGGTRCK